MERAEDAELMGSITDANEDDMHSGLQGPHFGSGSDQMLSGDMSKLRRRSLRQHQQVSQRPKMVVRRQHSLSKSNSQTSIELPPRGASVTDVRVEEPSQL